VSLNSEQCCFLWQADDSDSVVDTAGVVVSQKQCPDAVTEPAVVEPVIDFDNTFPVHINIERAFHLPMVLENRYYDVWRFCLGKLITYRKCLLDVVYCSKLTVIKGKG